MLDHTMEVGGLLQWQQYNGYNTSTDTRIPASVKHRKRIMSTTPNHTGLYIPNIILLYAHADSSKP